MKKTKKTKVLYLFVMFVLTITFIMANVGNSVYALDTNFKKDNSIDEIINSTYSYDNDTILVVMDKNTGGINKGFTKRFFRDIPIMSIKDLTHINGDVQNNQLLDIENFSQILEIKLSIIRY